MHSPWFLPLHLELPAFFSMVEYWSTLRPLLDLFVWHDLHLGFRILETVAKETQVAEAVLTH